MPNVIGDRACAHVRTISQGAANLETLTTIVPGLGWLAKRWGLLVVITDFLPSLIILLFYAVVVWRCLCVVVRGYR